MIHLIRSVLLGLTLWLVGVAALAQAPSARIDRIEPPNWWVGLEHPTLQLVVEGPGVARLQARVRHPGVRLLSRKPGDSPNYLFLQLALAPHTRPGTLQLELLDQGRVVARHAYALLAREPGSAQRKGFGPEDAVYLIVPDRFAQGRAQPVVLPDGANFSDKLERANPGARHGGDIEGIRQRLDYIAGMGFTQLWCTPMTENAQPSTSYHGYANTDLYRIDPRFGSNDDYRQLVREARAKGLGVIHDIVLNHIGDRHRWMRDLPIHDWINHGTRFVPTNHAHISVQDPYAAPGDRAAFVDGWFVETMPDLNTRQPQLAEYLIQNTIWWIEWAGLSGIREDTYSYADKQFLSSWSQRVMREYPRLNIVGEEMSDHAPMVAYWQRGQKNHDGYRSHMPSMMDFPLVAALRRALLAPESMQQGLFDLYQALGFDFVYPNPSNLMLFDGNHDTTRLMAELQGDEELARMALAFVATAPRIPQFFYGTELAWRGPYPRDDGLLRADFAGGWMGDASDAVTGRGLSTQEAGMQNWLRKLLNWRKRTPLLHHGKLMQYVPQDGSYVYFRHQPGQSGRVMVALNKNPQPLTLALDRFAEMIQPGLLAFDPISGRRFPLGATLELPPRSVLVLELSR